MAAFLPDLNVSKVVFMLFFIYGNIVVIIETALLEVNSKRAAIFSSVENELLHVLYFFKLYVSDIFV